VIAIDKLLSNFGKTIAVDNVSFKVELRELSLAGHNGAAKHPHENAYASLEAIRRLDFDQRIDLHQDRQRAQSQIGYLPENSPLYRK